MLLREGLPRFDLRSRRKDGGRLRCDPAAIRVFTRRAEYEYGGDLPAQESDAHYPFSVSLRPPARTKSITLFRPDLCHIGKRGR